MIRAISTIHLVTEKAKKLFDKLVDIGIDDFESTVTNSLINGSETEIYFRFNTEDDLIKAREVLSGIK